jgi:hypothetical protein
VVGPTAARLGDDERRDRGRDEVDRREVDDRVVAVDVEAELESCSG